MKASKIIIFSLVALLAIILMPGCSEHVDNLDSYDYTKVKTGDILLSDNNIISTDKYTSGDKAIGVVMLVKSDSVWVVSTKELGEKAYLDTLMTVSNVSSSVTALDGKENTAALFNSGRVSDAATATAFFGSPVYGWYLPSVGELRVLAMNLKSVEQTMEKIGGDKFKTTQYLSSTQDGSSSDTERFYAYCITLQSGNVSSMLKTETGEVRPVLRMKMQ